MRILIAESDPELAISIQAYLIQENYVCDMASSAQEARDFIGAFMYDCIVLDNALPDGGGTRVLNTLRGSQRRDKVIVISAPDSLQARVKALNSGADDYLARPFELSELNTRIAALVRGKKVQGRSRIVHHELVVDLSAGSVTVKGTPIALTRVEFDLLLLLLSNRDRVISKTAIAEIISAAAPHMHDHIGSVYRHVQHLKQKLAAAGCRDYIRTVHAAGYEFTGR